MKKLLYPFALLASAITAFSASAATTGDHMVGMAKPWELNFQTPASPVMHRLYDMHNFLLYLIVAISLFVLALMIYIAMRFNRKSNPVPSRTTHNTRLEIIWTTIPILILIAIAIPSLRTHYYMQKVVEPELTLKVVGYQWYWHYEYPDQGGFGYDSYIKKENLAPDEPRLLTVDNRVVVPVNTKVRVLVTGGDVIHSWAMPAFGVKRDGVPGRLNETWFEADKIGTFYGQCSELCGVGHGYMPIAVDVVSKEDFAAWVKKKQAEAGVSAAPANEQKTTAPVTTPVSAEHSNENATIEKEKSRSKPTASDNTGAKDRQPAQSKTVGNANQPKPAKAAEDAEPASGADKPAAQEEEPKAEEGKADEGNADDSKSSNE